eukprot:5840185-Prymnesium_polylepis.1
MFAPELRPAEPRGGGCCATLRRALVERHGGAGGEAARGGAGISGTPAERGPAGAAADLLVGIGHHKLPPMSYAQFFYAFEPSPPFAVRA